MAVEKMDSYAMPVKYDGSLNLAVGTSCKDTNWKAKTRNWSTLLGRLGKSQETPETHDEFMAMTKAQQDRIKDIGGFVGGRLKNGRRKAENVVDRSFVTLDADNAPPDFLDRLHDVFGRKMAYAWYSTHKHTPEKPRLRILIPLSRNVTPDEYEAIARKLADKVGIDCFDDTTYEPNRMMFWPSNPADVRYVFGHVDAPWLDADGVLAEYADWTDVASWPESSRAKNKRKGAAKKQGDPKEKPDMIGAFNRTYTIEDAIETFLSDVYAPCDDSQGRYTYLEGSTSGGLVVYDNEFAYSHHATDPASGMLCNAFDLVRVHKFGAQDDGTDPDTQISRLPSYKAMTEFCRQDEAVVKDCVQRRQTRAAKAFNDEEDTDWQGKLEIDRHGTPRNTLNNARMILQHDRVLKGIVFNELADNLEIQGGIPWAKSRNGGPRFWRDADDAQLENYLSENYAEFSRQKILSAITKVADDRSYHPIRQYLEDLPAWDGNPRIDTLLIDYLGAEDNIYTRAVTRKTLIAAIRRVKTPGIKFDTVLVLCGPQGIGKSMLLGRLGGKWFSDSLSLRDTDDKTAAEKLQGTWIVEIQEMAGLGSAGVKTLRAFITTQNDRYRASYGRRVSEHPRQCILIGTTNSEEGYLNDTDGGRRFWPVNTPGGDTLRPWDLTDADMLQIWAEAGEYEKNGESLLLNEEETQIALEMQKAAMIGDPREERVRMYLDRKIPEIWYDWKMEERLDYLDDDHPAEKAVNIRRRVSPQEIWVECFRRKYNDLQPKDVYTIKRIMTKFENWRPCGRFYARGEYGRVRGYERID